MVPVILTGVSLLVTPIAPPIIALSILPPAFAFDLLSPALTYKKPFTFEVIDNL